VISIDCGVSESYKDNTNNFPYQADDNTVVRFGQTRNISSDNEVSYESQIKKQLKSLRNFPDGKRNCYNLKPKQGKNHKYSTRAYFQYGNYDNKNKIPTFDLHLGVNLWEQVQLSSATSVLRTEQAWLCFQSQIRMSS
jgi:senescence-induced receptor-like serine/threonine-protein kinase